MSWPFNSNSYGNNRSSIFEVLKYEFFNICEFSVTSSWNSVCIVLAVGHTKIRRHHGTNGTDFIGCRQGEGGAINWCHV